MEDRDVGKSNKIISVGHIALDYIFNVEKFPEPNTSIQIPSVKKYYGGAACNVAVAVAKLGLQSGIVSCVGHDFVNSGYSSYLKNLNIDVSSVYHSDEEETPKAWIFTDPDHNQMTFFLWGAAKHYNELKPPTFDGSIVHLATGDPKFNIKCAKCAKEHNIMVSFDPGQDLPLYSKDDMYSILDNLDFMFMNVHEYKRILKLLEINPKDLKEKVPILIVTYGKDGSILYQNNSEIKIPTIPANVEDPTGAGDSYRAGFLSAYLKGYNLKDCGIVASAVASFVVEKKGCQTNLPSWEDVLKRIKDNGYSIGGDMIIP
ncbi:MAG TPA: carbohydrate kinase family protein [Methanothermococcus okinawensis]|uniref:Carbohydrate kinase family protein n=1 Tax=Methanothermococcus okinawensis TaxID=155863 RepID=A0A833DRC7_9EURY|nr:carbohydrate kinase family protein [Methanothermococcus okinawensis]